MAAAAYCLCCSFWKGKVRLGWIEHMYLENNRYRS